MTDYKEIVKWWNRQNVYTSNPDFNILFAYNSAKIENDEITLCNMREIFENGEVKGYTGNPRTLFETQNQKLCYEYLKDIIISRSPLSVPFILEVHRILTSGTFDEKRFIEKGERPGEFKKHDYVTGRLEVGADAVEVEPLLSELIDEVNAYKGEKVLNVAAYFHARFEYIHPFADGNGRVGRTLLNYYLMTNDHPPIIIYDEDKAAYYAALERHDEAEDIAPFTAFLQEQAVKTWQRVVQRDAPSARKKLDDFTR